MQKKYSEVKIERTWEDDELYKMNREAIRKGKLKRHDLEKIK